MRGRDECGSWPPSGVPSEERMFEQQGCRIVPRQDFDQDTTTRLIRNDNTSNSPWQSEQGGRSDTPWASDDCKSPRGAHKGMRESLCAPLRIFRALPSCRTFPRHQLTGSDIVTLFGDVVILDRPAGGPSSSCPLQGLPNQLQ